MIKGDGDSQLLTVKWCKPPISYVKLNTDGNRFNDLSYGYGGVLRSDKGNWLMGFSTSSMAMDITLVELLALKEGLNIAWNVGYKKIICEIDSGEAVALLRDHMCPRSISCFTHYPG